MALHQCTVAQNFAGFAGHATRAGVTEKQPWHYDFSSSPKGYGFPQPPTFEDKHSEREYLKGRLAAAFRIFGKYGFNEGVAGHITVRDPVDPSTFWVNPFGVGFPQIKRSDLLRINHNGEVLEGGPVRLINRAAVMIHAAVHAARPDVTCAAHTHSIYGRTFSTLGLDLPITSQDGCAFYNDLVTLKSFEGIVLEGEEGVHIAQNLGSNKAMILQNHGLLTTGATVEATVFWYISLERLCHTQLLAMAACACPGVKVLEIGHHEAEVTYQSVGQPMSGWFSAKPIFDEIAINTNEDYLD